MEGVLGRPPPCPMACVPACTVLAFACVPAYVCPYLCSPPICAPACVCPYLFCTSYLRPIAPLHFKLHVPFIYPFNSNQGSPETLDEELTRQVATTESTAKQTTCPETLNRKLMKRPSAPFISKTHSPNRKLYTPSPKTTTHPKAHDSKPPYSIHTTPPQPKPYTTTPNIRSWTRRPKPAARNPK